MFHRQCEEKCTFFAGTDIIKSYVHTVQLCQGSFCFLYTLETFMIFAQIWRLAESIDNLQRFQNAAEYVLIYIYIHCIGYFGFSGKKKILF